MKKRKKKKQFPIPNDTTDPRPKFEDPSSVGNRVEFLIEDIKNLMSLMSVCGMLKTFIKKFIVYKIHSYGKFFIKRDIVSEFKTILTL